MTRIDAQTMERYLREIRHEPGGWRQLPAPMLQMGILSSPDLMRELLDAIQSSDVRYRCSSVAHAVLGKSGPTSPAFARVLKPHLDFHGLSVALRWQRERRWDDQRKPLQMWPHGVEIPSGHLWPYALHLGTLGEWDEFERLIEVDPAHVPSAIANWHVASKPAPVALQQVCEKALASGTAPEEVVHRYLDYRPVVTDFHRVLVQLLETGSTMQTAAGSVRAKFLKVRGGPGPVVAGWIEHLEGALQVIRQRQAVRSLPDMFTMAAP